MDKLNKELYNKITNKTEKQYIKKLINIYSSKINDTVLTFERAKILNRKRSYTLEFFEYILAEFPELIHVLYQKEKPKFREIKPALKRHADFLFSNRINKKIPDYLFSNIGQELEKDEIDDFVLKLLDFYPTLTWYSSSIVNLIQDKVLLEEENTYFSIITNINICYVNIETLKRIPIDRLLILLKASYNMQCRELYERDTFSFDDPRLEPYQTEFIPMYLAKGGDVEDILDILEGFDFDKLDLSKEKAGKLNYDIKNYLKALENFLIKKGNTKKITARLSNDCIKSCIQEGKEPHTFMSAMRESENGSILKVKAAVIKRYIGNYISKKENLIDIFKEFDNYYLTVKEDRNFFSEEYFTALINKGDDIFNNINEVSGMSGDLLRGSILGEYLLFYNVRLENKDLLSNALQKSNVPILPYLHENLYFLDEILKSLPRERVLELLLSGSIAPTKTKVITKAMYHILKIKKSDSYIKKMKILVELTRKLELIWGLEEQLLVFNGNHKVLNDYFLEEFWNMTDDSIESYTGVLEKRELLLKEKEKLIEKFKKTIEI